MPTGTEVAVKVRSRYNASIKSGIYLQKWNADRITFGPTQVRHPGVGKAISRDFELMMAAASVAELLPSMKRLRIRESLKQFAAPLQEQVQDSS